MRRKSFELIDKEKECKTCKKIHNFYGLFCSISCAHTRSVESKIKISNSRKKYLCENKEKHPWKNSNKFISKPCEDLKEILKQNNISFIEEYCPLDDRSYAIDIAFPNIKVGVEVNGSQHYNRDGTLSKYYQDRHDLIVASGWKLLEINYMRVYDKDVLENIKSFYIDPTIQEIENFKTKTLFSLREAKKKEKSDIELQIKETRIQNEKDRMVGLIYAIENSNIDFTQGGWRTEVSKILNIAPQCVGRWMRNNMPEFYIKCSKGKWNKTRQ